MYKTSNNRKQIPSIRKNSGFIVIGGILWLSFALAGAGVAAVDYAMDDNSAVAIAQTPPPALAEN